MVELQRFFQEKQGLLMGAKCNKRNEIRIKLNSNTLKISWRHYFQFPYYWYSRSINKSRISASTEDNGY